MWSINTIKEALKINNRDVSDIGNISGVSIDTRTIKSGELFIAIKGDNFDGNDFIQEAEKNGAVVAIVERQDNKVSIPQILVKDAYQALVSLAQYKREHSKATFIAITGSVGKTSCKSALHKILSLYDKSYASIGNYNNHIGLPLSLVNMPNDTKFGVFELGMNHKGEIKYLSDILRPNFAWITVVNDAHSENFDSAEGIIYAKSEIFSGLNKDGVIILNNDDKNYNKLKEIAIEEYKYPENAIRSYGEGSRGELIIKEISLNQTQEFMVSYVFQEKKQDVIFSIYNIALIRLLLGIIIILSELKLNHQTSINHFRKISPISGRGNIIKKNNLTIIDDSYNANPASMNAAFDNLNILGEISGQRTVAIIGTMLELGDDSIKKHMELKESLLKNHINKVITIGDHMEDLHHILPSNMRVIHLPKTPNDIAEIKSHLQKDDIILVKASRGIKTDLIVKELTK